MLTKQTATIDRAVVRATEKVLKEQFVKAVAYDELIFLLQEEARKRGLFFFISFEEHRAFIQTSEGFNSEEVYTLQDGVALLMRYIGKPVEASESE